MARYYKVIKDHPMWEIGAIISNKDDSRDYRPISDLFVKDINGVTEKWYEGSALVENQSEWFERVYEHKVVGAVKYLSKEVARQLIKDQYK